MIKDVVANVSGKYYHPSRICLPRDGNMTVKNKIKLTDLEKKRLAKDGIKF